MAEGNGLEIEAGPAKIKATGERSLQAAAFIALIVVLGFGFYSMSMDHQSIRTEINRLTIATITSEEDKKSAIGSNLREELKEEIRKTAEHVVRKGRGD